VKPLSQELHAFQRNAVFSGNQAQDRPNMSISTYRSGGLALIGLLIMLIGGCARVPDTGVTPLKPMPLKELRENLLSQKADVDQFRARGPFPVSSQENLTIRLSTTETVVTDLFLSENAEKSPLVIFLHGYDGSKEYHAYQAMHLASWGMNALTVQLPNQGPWTENGRTLAKLVRFIRQWPEILDNRIDLTRIILVGYSFGGSSVAVALADGAPVMGGILLDPAAIDRDFPAHLRKIDKPVLLLGADEQIYSARNRNYFYRFMRNGIIELSIKDATHEDAQFPAQFGMATEAIQVTFVSAITAAAISLSSTGGLEYAWDSFGDALKNGKLIKARRK
jgi:pimeloyl-ACP methyl ester carboxylesterase